MTTFLDEVRQYWTGLHNVPVEWRETIKVKYTFNRRLTWSEREALAQWLAQDELFVEHKVNAEDPRIVTVVFLEEDDFDSRSITEIISGFAETLLNVHPVSAHTLEPRVRV